MSEPAATPPRLSKYIAGHTGLSRREVDDFITRGQVSLNGVPADLGNRYHEGDEVKLSGHLVTPVSPTLLLLNKPVGYVCSRKQQGETPTIYSLLPKEYYKLKPIGRLDADSSGLLLLSDDGDLAHRLTHPKFHKQKSYEVSLDADLQPLHHQMLNEYGVELEDGPSRLTLERMHEGDSKQWRVLMHEGRNRQIRRTFTALGYTVTSLHRTHFGDYALDDIKSGEFVLAP